MIENLIEDFAQGLGQWAYLFVAVMATAETAAFVGFIAPGEFTIILGGVLAGEGTLSIYVLIAIVWASIVVGDSIGFMIGRKAGRGFLLEHGHRVRLTEERLQQVEDYFRRHGGKTIFFGRWVGFVRPLMPFTAGTSSMPYSRFLPYDILSAGLFGSFFCLLGYVFWRNLDTVTSVVGRGALGLGVIVALVVGGVLLYKRLRDPQRREELVASLQRFGRRPLVRPFAFALSWIWAVALGPLWRWAIRPLVRYVLAPIWQLMTPPLRFVGQRLTPGELGIEFTTLLAIAAVSVFAFGAYVDVVANGTGLTTPGDRVAFDIAREIESGFLTSLAKAVSVLGTWQIVTALVALASIALIALRRLLEAAVLAIGFGASQAAVYITKAAVERPRPGDALVDASGSSFPSGHAATAVAYVALAVVLSRALRGRVPQAGIVIGAIVLAAAIGLTRVYLRVHYMSDVTAGWAAGAGVFALCGALALVISFVRNNDRSPSEPAVARPLGSPGDG